MQYIMQSRHLQLNTLEAGDVAQIYRWESEVETRPLWQDSNALPSALTFSSDFARKMENFYQSYFLISFREQKEALGCVYSYGYNRTDGFMHISVFIDRKYRGEFVGAEAGILFCAYLFRYFPVRKLYSVAFSYNEDSVKLLEAAGFQREGTLKQHKYLKGRYYDMYTYAIYREDMERLVQYIMPPTSVNAEQGMAQAQEKKDGGKRNIGET